MPGYLKTIVCLANSRKMSGRCIAGKTFSGGAIGEWLRPVSSREHEEISEEDRRYEDGTRAQLLDIIRIPMLRGHPHSYQSENHVIDDQRHWERIGRATWENLTEALDDGFATLWENGYSSYSGTNDRVPLELANTLGSSLAFISVDNIDVVASAEGAAFGNMKRRVRARWHRNGADYALRVTDPEIEAFALARPDEALELGAAYICVSLGEPYEGYAYKLAAAIITPSRVGPV